MNHADFNRLSGRGVLPNDGIYILIVTMVSFAVNLRDFFSTQENLVRAARTITSSRVAKNRCKAAENSFKWFSVDTSSNPR